MYQKVLSTKYKIYYNTVNVFVRICFKYSSSEFYRKHISFDCIIIQLFYTYKILKRKPSQYER